MSTGNSKIKINMDSLKARRDWKRHKVKDGHNVFRILPPFGESSNGYPYRKWSIIWGLMDPESGRARPFASSITSEKKCPVTEYAQALKKKAETLKTQLLSSGVSEDDAKERLTSLNNLISDLNPKTVYIYNATDKSGEVGLLELKSTAHKQMKSEMTSYIQDYNQDPTSLNSEDTDSGIWFDVVRSGVGRDTEYTVKRVQSKTKGANGKLTFEDDRSTLPDSIVENYANLAYDLGSVYQIKSYDDLAEILEANMASLIETCPYADLSVDGVLPQPVTTKPTKAAFVSKPTGTKAINVRLDDDEEEVEVRSTKNSSRSTTMSASSDDDFLAQADALLNS